MATQKDADIHPERNPVLRLIRRFVRVTEDYEGGRFFVRRSGRLLATPLFIVVLVVETTDVIFAVDSIPAILAITLDPFIVYTSNVFAIMGLRALYFALAGIMQLFHYLPYGLSFILVFVGIKMLLVDIYKIPIGMALGTVAACTGDLGGCLNLVPAEAGGQPPPNQTLIQPGTTERCPRSDGPRGVG